MAFAEERQAFAAYASALPDNCVFLVDTYGTISGIQNAIQVARDLRAQGHELIGIRLDSGDLAYFSKHARIMLDEAGLPDALVMASNGQQVPDDIAMADTEPLLSRLLPARVTAAQMEAA